MTHKTKKQFKPFDSPAWSLLVKSESEINRKTRQFFADTTDTSRLLKEKNPKHDLKLHYKKVYELTFAFTLIFLISSVQFAKYFSFDYNSLNKVNVNIEIADIPVTKQFIRPHVPKRPVVPIPSEEESIPDDETISSTEIDLSNIPAPPPPLDDEELPAFFAFDEPPKIIGGIAALQKHLKYPKLARQSGIEGIVFLRVLVSIDGKTEKVEILRAKPDLLGFKESAIEAVKKIKWIPAKQRDKNCRVWIALPIEFKLIEA